MEDRKYSGEEVETMLKASNKVLGAQVVKLGIIGAITITAMIISGSVWTGFLVFFFTSVLCS